MLFFSWAVLLLLAILIISGRGGNRLRIILWAIFLAYIGGALATKTALIDIKEVVIGTIEGGLVGALIGWLMVRLKKKDKNQ